jgi:hypothetical protein
MEKEVDERSRADQSSDGGRWPALGTSPTDSGGVGTVAAEESVPNAGTCILSVSRVLSCRLTNIFWTQTRNTT